MQISGKNYSVGCEQLDNDVELIFENDSFRKWFHKWIVIWAVFVLILTAACGIFSIMYDQRKNQQITMEIGK